MYNQHMANRTLLAVFLLFVAANGLKYYYREWWLVDGFRFITEAALVGGLADWFAVTALFRKPLGFPWHTAIIPRQRQRVIGELANMVETELLSPAVIKRRVEKTPLMEKVIYWVEKQDGRMKIRQGVEGLLPMLLAKVDVTAVEFRLWTLLQGKAAQGVLLPYLKKGIVWLLQEGRYEKAVIWLVGQGHQLLTTGEIKKEIHQYLLAMKEDKTKSILEKFLFWVGEQTDSVNLEEAAEALYDKLLVLIDRLKQPEHEIHQWVKRQLLQMTEEEDAFSQLESWQSEWLEALRSFGFNRELILAGLTALRSQNSLFYRWLSEQGEGYWAHFKENPAEQVWLEERIKLVLYRLIDREHHLIGQMVRTVMENFSDEELIEFVEEKAGEDLQWIRINGCVVGGLVGALLFLLLKFVYQPLLVWGRWL